jgi:cardiolipin synthase
VPLRRKWNINYRNHRKIVVIDGKVAYTGSQNIGDEYRGLWRKVGPWKDTHLRIEGPAAQQLQEIFITDWYFAAEEDLAASRYLRREPPRGRSLVQIVPSGPDQQSHVLHELVFLAIAHAQKKVRVSTPYFVPDPALLLALKSAAHRGISVEILIPSCTDNRLALWAGRSYYQELLETGLRIFENPRAMLHSKVVTIDDLWSIVGSANMDVRSFLFNFEITASIFDGGICRELNATFQKNCAEAEPMKTAWSARRPFVASILEGAARLCSPLL